MELPKIQRTTLTMKEAAEYLGVSYWLINQLVRKKQIPCSKVGGKYLFRVQALDEYLKNIIVADLKSTDKTKEIVKKLAEEYQTIKPLSWKECKDIMDNIDDT